MSAASLFSLANSAAALAWIALLIQPYSPALRSWLYRVVVVGLGLLYAGLFLPASGALDPMAFTTLEGIQGLFSQPEAVLVGWVHYLAFDLLAGLYIARDAQKNELNRWLITLPLLFTFMAGPLGFTLYVLVRTSARRHYRFE